MIYKLLELKNKINRKKFSGEVVNLFTFPNVIQVQQHTELNKHKHAIMDVTEETFRRHLKTFLFNCLDN